ncbi:MAG: SpoIIIAH-like family protein [Clostridia bacterium]|nr:SpoIIIAH-like family protein [Clostridia bacterium]
MKKGKLQKKHFIFMGLFLALCITGTANYYLSKKTGGQQLSIVSGAEEQENETAQTFYQSFRTDRSAARAEEIAYLDTIITGEKTDPTTKKDAEQQKLALISAIETEANIEGLVKALGYKECVVTVKPGSVNVVLDNEKELTEANAAQIFEIVRTEAGEKSENVKIILQN